MSTFLENILDKKEKEVAVMQMEEIQLKRSTYCFYDFLRQNSDTMQLIAEVKRASPSKGDINLDVDVVSQAKSYEQAGAAAISVLTDPAYFKGSIEDLRLVAENVRLPILCKDFIIDEKQLVRARNAGATIILLIVSALSQNQLENLFEQAKSLDLEVLVEVHDEKELMIAEALGAKLIGVNNRNLHSFQVDISVSETLATKQQNTETACYISESGFRLQKDVIRVKDKYQAVLVGEALMRENDPRTAAEHLKVAR